MNFYCGTCGGLEEQRGPSWSDFRCPRCESAEAQLTPDVVQWIRDVVAEALRRDREDT